MHGKTSGVAKRAAKWTRDGWVAYANAQSVKYERESLWAEKIAENPRDASGRDWSMVQDAKITPQTEPIDWDKVSAELRDHAAHCRSLAASVMIPPPMRHREGGWKIGRRL